MWLWVVARTFLYSCYLVVVVTGLFICDFYAVVGCFQCLFYLVDLGVWALARGL